MRSLRRSADDDALSPQTAQCFAKPPSGAAPVGYIAHMAVPPTSKGTLVATRFVPLLAAFVISLAFDTGGAKLGSLSVRVIVLLAALVAVGRTRRTLIIGALLIVPAIVTIAVAGARPGMLSAGLSIGFAVLFLAYVAWTTLRAMLRVNQVSVDVIAGGIAVYLLLGFLFGLLFTLVELIHPGSFSDLGGQRRYVDFTYYSFVTLSTLGYGDIVPLSSVARRMSVVEALTGQIYLAVFIGRLVGVYRGRREREAEASNG